MATVQGDPVRPVGDWHEALLRLGLAQLVDAAVVRLNQVVVVVEGHGARVGVWSAAAVGRGVRCVGSGHSGALVRRRVAAEDPAEIRSRAGGTVGPGVIGGSLDAVRSRQGLPIAADVYASAVVRVRGDGQVGGRLGSGVETDEHSRAGAESGGVGRAGHRALAAAWAGEGLPRGGCDVVAEDGRELTGVRILATRQVVRHDRVQDVGAAGRMMNRELDVDGAAGVMSGVDRAAREIRLEHVPGDLRCVGRVGCIRALWGHIYADRALRRQPRCDEGLQGGAICEEYLNATWYGVGHRRHRDRVDHGPRRNRGRGGRRCAVNLLPGRAQVLALECAAYERGIENVHIARVAHHVEGVPRGQSVQPGVT